jgi:hypothetical protein
MRSLMAWSLVVASVVFSGAASAENPGKTVDVRLEAGHTYVIDQLSRNAAARISIIDNPNALVVNSGLPGELMLVGAEAGRWEIIAERANGQQVTYDVRVTSIARPFSNPLAPGKLPPGPDQMTSNGSPAGLESGSISNGQPKTVELSHIGGDQK